ncbi:MAG TPA: diacylglycerol kinase family protein [Steroidobacteraceae bacterium]|nr:diacylglycerol kinase family protein [Steroidobacteraceae bacterium]
MASTAPALHIICNAGSGSSDAREARQQIEDILAAARRRHDFILVDDPARLPEMAQQAVEAAVRDEGAVVVAGGDGTINTVAQAVLPTGRPFGIVPQGTFNYSPRAHGIPLDTTAATKALLTARLKPVQVGLVNDRVFLVNASLGLYPELLEDREEYKREHGRKRSVAMWAGLRTLMREHRPLVVEVDHDSGREVIRTPSIFIGNNPLQLEQVGLAEAAEVQRRKLAAVIVKPVGRFRLLGLALRGMLGQLGEAQSVRDFAFRSMSVRPLSHRALREMKVAVDGEVFWSRPPLQFSVAPQPLMLMVPDEATQSA